MINLTNLLVMGDIPSTNNMISTIIKSPQTGQDLQANQAFTVDLQVQNLEAGAFTNADSTYYAAPQALKGGNIAGHTHVTIQSLGNDINTQTPPDPTTFAFFKGINDPGDGNGGLSASVASGLPAGVYRVCTMTSASNHQPVLMPV
jgi:transcription initiation factor TFIID subunit 15